MMSMPMLNFTKLLFLAQNYDDSTAVDVRKQSFKAQVLNDLSVMADRYVWH